MNPKIQALLDRFKGGGAGRKLRGGFSAFKWIFLLGSGTLISAVGALSIWFHYRPMSIYREQVVTYVQRQTGADKVRLRGLDWVFSAKSLAVGVRASDFGIEGFGKLNRFFSKDTRVMIQPLRFFTGKIPIKIEISDGEILARDDSVLPHASPPRSGTSDAVEKLVDPRFLPSWAKLLRIQITLDEVNLQADPLLLKKNPEDSILKANRVHADVSMSGLPGPFSVKFESELDVILDAGSKTLRGQFSTGFGGFFQVVNNRPVGIKIEDIHASADEMNVSWGTWLRKAPDLTLNAKASAQIMLDSQLKMNSFDLQNASVQYEELNMQVEAGLDRAKDEFSLRVNAGPIEVRDLHLPFAGIQEVPVHGIFETAITYRGSLLNSERVPDATWKIGLNNFRVHLEKIPSLLDPSSKGEINFSFVSEGTLANGNIVSPRTEFQLNGTEAQIELANAKFTKPAGDPLTLLFKAEVKDDDLTVHKLTFVMNNLNAEGTAKLSGVSAYIGSKKIPQLRLDLNSNRVDLTRWSTYFPIIRKIPLQGNVQAAGTAEGPLNVTHPDEMWKDLSWRVDRLSLSNIRGAFDREAFVQMGYARSDFAMAGPFVVDFLFQGRGQGSLVQRASLTSDVDLSDLTFVYKDTFRKPAGVPLRIEVSADQSQNQLNIRKGSFRFHELFLGFDGTLLQGSRKSSIGLKMAKPVRLSDWRQFFFKLPESLPLDGDIKLDAKFGFQKQGAMEGSLDWRDMSFEGDLSFDRLATKLGSFKNPLTKGRGRVLVSGRSITLPSLAFEMGGSRFFISGDGKVLAPKAQKSAGNLGLFAGDSPWDLSTQISVDDFHPEIFESTGTASANASRPVNVTADEGPSLGQRLKSMMQTPRLAQSRAKIRFRAQEGKSAGLKSSDLNAVFSWDKGLLRLEPMSLRAFGGKVSGAVVFDASNFVRRKENPQSTVLVQLSNVDLHSLAESFKPDVAPLLQGRMTGNLNLASQGFEADEWINHARGRLYGKIEHGQFDSLKVLKKSIDEMISVGVAKDYLLQQGDKEQCVQKAFSGEVDAQIADGHLEIGRSDLGFETGSRVLMKGGVSKDLTLSLKGDFVAGPKCISGDARLCLQGADGLAKIPFEISGNASTPEISVDTAGISKSLVACLGRKVAEQAKEVIQNQIQQGGGLEDLEKAAKEKLKNIFKGR